MAQLLPSIYDLWPRIHEQKNSKVSNGWIRYVKQTEILTHATHVNGWEPAVYMSCMSQNFRLFHVSNSSVRNFRNFLLMYTGSLLIFLTPMGVERGGGTEGTRPRSEKIRRGRALQFRDWSGPNPVSSPILKIFWVLVGHTADDSSPPLKKKKKKKKRCDAPANTHLRTSNLPAFQYPSASSFSDLWQMTSDVLTNDLWQFGQGLMFGYATDETQECMPLTVVLAHNLNRKISEMRKEGSLWWARPDSKTQVCPGDWWARPDSKTQVCPGD